jgi:mRNA interferase HigB
MRLIGKNRMANFKREHPDALEQVSAWEKEIEAADWKSPHDLKTRYPKASLLGNQQVVFNMCWNNYRIWVEIAYRTGVVMVKEAGTHKEYEKWDIK